jgi:hypothetical protein
MASVSQPGQFVEIPSTRVDELAVTVTGLRSRLTGIAHAMLGRTVETEDVVSDCVVAVGRGR